MPTYIYETIPASDSERPERFEIKQSMKDEPLTRHPDSGLPVRRVISGGYGFSVGGAAAPSSGHGCGGGSCGCHN